MADRYISQDIWDDPEFLDLDGDSQRVWLYLLSSRVAGRCGIFRLNPAIAGAVLKLSQRKIRSSIQGFLTKNWIETDEKLWVFIRSYVKFQSKQRLWLTVCANEAKALIPSTSLANRLFKLYPELNDCVDTINPQSKRLCRPQAQAQAQAQAISECSKKNIPAKQVSRRVSVPAVDLDLSVLETEIPLAAVVGWNLFKGTVAAENKSGTVSVGRLYGMLTELLDKAKKYQLDGDALAYGLAAAVQAGAGNVNYVIKAARSYKPPDEQPKNRRWKQPECIEFDGVYAR